MKHFRWVLAVSLLVMGMATSAFADGFDFLDIFNSIPKTGTFLLSDISGQAGVTVNGATVQILTSGGTTFTITGYWFNGSAWVTDGVSLIGRNENAGDSIDRGIGICSSGETNCLGSASGDINEISDQLHPEVFQVTMSGTPLWNKFGPSSLDTNGLSGPPPERGQLYSSNTNIAGLNTSLTTLHLLCNFTISGASGPCAQSPFVYPTQTEEPFFGFPEDHSTYLYVTGSDPQNSANTNNDFLLRRINDPSIPETQVPEPSSLILLATGLGGASLGIRRKFRG